MPTGTYTGNAVDQIEVEAFVTIEEDVTASDHGVPYWVSSSNPLRVARVFNGTGAIPQLTIAAGVTLAFEPGSNAALKVGTNSTPPQPGSLSINGTSAALVTLTSAAVAPAAGDWDGVVLATGAGEAGAAQSIDYAVIEYAGGDSAIGGYACYSEDGSGTAISEDGAVVIYGWAPTASFVTNSMLQHSLGWGVFRGWDTTQGGDVDFSATNSFLDLTACEQNNIKDTCANTVTYACAGTI